jgi:hypothetical protein
MSVRRSLLDVRRCPKFLGLELRDVGCKYLYAGEDGVTLIDERTLEQHTIPTDLIKPEVKSLLEGNNLGNFDLHITLKCYVHRWNDGQIENGSG